MKIADTSAQDIALAPRRRYKTMIIWAGFLLLLLLFAWLAMPAVQGWSRAQESVSSDRLRLSQVIRGDFVRDVTVQGRVVAAVSPTLFASQSGTITFQVEAGDSVEAEQILASIDSPEMQNRLLQERSRLTSLEIEQDRQRITNQQQQLERRKALDSTAINLKAAQREMKRSEIALERGAATEVDFDKSRDQLETAEVLYNHAVLDTELDKERLDFELQTRQLAVEQQQLLVADIARQVEELAILSPVSGIVGNLLVNQKANVVRNQPVLSVVDLSAFEVEILVPESYVETLAPGMIAEVRAGSNSYKTTLVAVSPEIIDNQVSGRLRFIDAVPESLRQNQRLTTRILLEEKLDVLMVQRGQFLESGNGRIAYVVRNGVAYRTPILTGATSLSSVEMLEGVQAGDTIIVSSTDAFNSAETVLIN